MQIWAYGSKEGSLRFFRTKAEAETARDAELRTTHSIFDGPMTDVRHIKFKTAQDLVNFLNHYAA